MNLGMSMEMCTDMCVDLLEPRMARCNDKWTNMHAKRVDTHVHGHVCVDMCMDMRTQISCAATSFSGLQCSHLHPCVQTCV